jgi:hypothetical protein
MLASLAAGSAATVTPLDSRQKVLADLGLRESDVFILAEQSAQGDLVRQTIHLVSQPIFWIVRFSGDVAARFPKDEQEAVWKHYNESVVTWNEYYWFNSMLTEKYFGASTRDQMVNIYWMMHIINNCLNRIHYRELYEGKDPACQFTGVAGGRRNKTSSC